MRWEFYLFILVGIIFLALPFLLANGVGIQTCGGGCSSGGCAFSLCVGSGFPGGTAAPTINIVSPLSQYYKTLTGINLKYTYTIGSGFAYSQCWYNIKNSTGQFTTANTTIPGCANTTISVPADGNYNVTTYINDTTGQIASDTQYFAVASSGPAIVLNSPDDYQWFNSTNNINVSANLSDVYPISLCTFYQASSQDAFPASGLMVPTYSFFSPITNNGTLSHLFNFSDSYNTWNLWCLDQQGLNNFALVAWHFGVDSTPPAFSNVAITNTLGTQTQSFSFNVSDIALQNCTASIVNSTGQEEPLYAANKSVACNSAGNSFTVTDYGNYNLLLYANNSAGLTSLSNTSFSVSPTPIPSGGGGGGAGPEIVYPTVSLIQPKNISFTYSDLDRAIIFATFNSYCSRKVQGLAVIDYYTQCLLSYSDLSQIQGQLNNSRISIPTSEIPSWYQQYKQNLLYQTYSTQDQITQYSLVEAIVRNPLKVNPPAIDTPIIVPQDKILKYNVLASKTIKSCDVVSQEYALLSNGSKINPFSCILLTNTTAQIRYKIYSPKFSEVYQGQIAVTSGSQPQDQETVYVNVIFRAYWLQYPVLGIPIIAFFIVGGIVSLGLIYALIFFIRGMVTKKKTPLFQGLKKIFKRK